MKNIHNGTFLDNVRKSQTVYEQYSMKKWVYKIIISVIVIGLIIPFASEVICTIWFPDYTLGLNTWNQFVSIILGIVATILSIVSLIMGFKNYDDSLELHEKHVEVLDKISSISKDVLDVKEKIDKVNLSNNTNDKTFETLAQTIWNNDQNIKSN